MGAPVNAGPPWRRWRKWFRKLPWLHRRLIRVRETGINLALAVVRRAVPARWHVGPPKGWFLLAERIRAGTARGRIVVEQPPAPRGMPGCLRELARLGQLEHRPWSIFWSQHREARLIGSTLLLQEEDGRVAAEAALGHPAVLDDPGFREFRHGPPVRLAGNWTSISWRWSGGFYHWLMDALPRLALLSEFPPDTRVIVPANLSGYQRETLAWLGLADRIRPTAERHLVVENFYFSSPTNHTGCFDPYAVDWLRRTFLPRQEAAGTPRRFYVRRVGVSRGITNEAELLALFEQRGWAVVDTAEMTLARQIALFARADAVCALHGAALTNLVWCPPGCRVLELAASTYLNGVFEGIAEAAGVEHRFLIGPGTEDFAVTVDVAAVEKAMPWLERAVQ